MSIFDQMQQQAVRDELESLDIKKNQEQLAIEREKTKHQKPTFEKDACTSKQNRIFKKILGITLAFFFGPLGLLYTNKTWSAILLLVFNGGIILGAAIVDTKYDKGCLHTIAAVLVLFGWLFSVLIAIAKSKK